MKNVKEINNKQMADKMDEQNIMFFFSVIVRN